MNEVYLLTGSNRGDRLQNLQRACKYIEEEAGAVSVKSNIWESSPWGFHDDTFFYNQVLGLSTAFNPEQLLDILLRIEIQMGRIRFFSESGCGGISCSSSGGPAYEPRIIDIDILFYGSRMIFSERLMIPHPRLHERLFTLMPLMEVAPAFVHPVLKKSIKMLRQECQDTSIVRLIS